MGRKPKVVLDTSSIISLAVIDQLEILHKLFAETIIPGAVWNELLRTDIPNIAKIKKVFKDCIREASDCTYLLPFVDEGEAEAIVLCRENESDFLVIDDKKGRSIAAEMGIECIGTLGILFEAKRKKLVYSLRDLFLSLLKNNRYYSRDLLNHLLDKAGEERIK